MYRAIKEKSRAGYIIPDIIEDTLCDMLADCCGIARQNKYVSSSYSVALKQKIKNHIQDLFSLGKTNYENNELFYSLYYLPNNIFKIWVPLTDLMYRKLLKTNMCALELGAGPGTSTFGLLEFYREMALINPQQIYRIEIDIVEKQNGFIAIFKNVLQEYIKTLPKNLKVILNNCICTEISGEFTFLKERKYDLIFASNMFNLNEKFGDDYFFTCCKNLKPFLNENSSMIFIEPGEHIISDKFKKTRNYVESESVLHIFSPCCCHFQQEHIRCGQFAVAHIRNIQSKMLDLLSEFGIASTKKGTHSFDYVVFRNDGLNKYEPTLRRRTKLNDVDWTKIGERVNVVAGVLSVNYKDGKVGLLLCDGTLQNKVWLNLSAEDLTFHRIDVDIIRGEKIDLKGAVIVGCNKLSISKNTEIEVSF